MSILLTYIYVSTHIVPMIYGFAAVMIYGRLNAFEFVCFCRHTINLHTTITFELWNYIFEKDP